MELLWNSLERCWCKKTNRNRKMISFGVKLDQRWEGCCKETCQVGGKGLGGWTGKWEKARKSGEPSYEASQAPLQERDRRCPLGGTCWSKHGEPSPWSKIHAQIGQEPGWWWSGSSCGGWAPCQFHHLLQQGCDKSRHEWHSHPCVNKSSSIACSRVDQMVCASMRLFWTMDLGLKWAWWAHQAMLLWSHPGRSCTRKICPLLFPVLHTHDVVRIRHEVVDFLWVTQLFEDFVVGHCPKQNGASLKDKLSLWQNEITEQSEQALQQVDPHRLDSIVLHFAGVDLLVGVFLCKGCAMGLCTHRDCWTRQQRVWPFMVIAKVGFSWSKGDWRLRCAQKNGALGGTRLRVHTTRLFLQLSIWSIWSWRACTPSKFACCLSKLCLAASTLTSHFLLWCLDLSRRSDKLSSSDVCRQQKGSGRPPAILQWHWIQDGLPSDGQRNTTEESPPPSNTQWKCTMVVPGQQPAHGHSWPKETASSCEKLKASNKDLEESFDRMIKCQLTSWCDGVTWMNCSHVSIFDSNARLILQQHQHLTKFMCFDLATMRTCHSCLPVKSGNFPIFPCQLNTCTGEWFVNDDHLNNFGIGLSQWSFVLLWKGMPNANFPVISFVFVLLQHF